MAVKAKEEQQGRILEYQHFDLAKFKVTDKGVDVSHYDRLSNSGKNTLEGKETPHPDLQNALDKLSLYMAQRLGLLDGWDFSRDQLRGDLEKLQMAKQGHEEMVKRCHLNGFTYVGDGETRGVQFTGNVKLKDGGSVGLAVGKITFGKDVLGYEDDVEQLCEDVKVEVYAYRFQSKKAQLDVETEAAKAKNPDMFDPPKPEKKGKKADLKD